MCLLIGIVSRVSNMAHGPHFFFITWLIHSLTSPGVVDVCPLYIVLRRETPLLFLSLLGSKCEHFKGHYMLLYELSYKVMF